MNIIEKFNNCNISKVDSKKVNFDFNTGDTVAVSYRILEANNTRIQSFEGTVIAKHKGNKNYNASFVVRKISGDIGVEKKFLLYSPIINEVKLVRKGVVNRAKIYFLRDRKGKATRIKEKI